MEASTSKNSAIEADKALVESFKNNKEMKEIAFELAHQIKGVFPEWFSIPKIVKKFKTTTEDAAKKIELLMLFNICIAKVEKDIPYFKIDLDHRTQRELLTKQIAEKEGELLFLKEKLSQLD